MKEKDFMKSIGTIEFDDFLKIRKNQAEFDRRVQKAIATSAANHKRKQKFLEEDGVEYEVNRLRKEVHELKKQIIHIATELLILKLFQDTAAEENTKEICKCVEMILPK